VSKDFIKGKSNSNHLLTACKQQKQLLYFTESKVQEDIQSDYINTWADSKYATSDYFLNWVKNIFKTENFLLVYKHLRYPLPSARLINDKIKTPLKRVFYSEDPFFKYEINGDLVKHPKGLDIEAFNDKVFNALFFRHNDIMVVNLSDVNTPFKSLISIENVISIDSNDSIIHKIAYSAVAEINGKNEKGVLYIDKDKYVFYDKDIENALLEVNHDLGRCPADYISSEAWSDSDIVRKSIFSHVRGDLEEYVFLKTLQRMVEAKGVIPTITMLDAPTVSNGDTDVEDDLEPMSASSISSQQAHVRSTVDGGNSILESGNVIKVPMVRNEDTGAIEMEVVTNFLNFFYVPTEALEFLNKRVKEVKAQIISDLLGDYSETSTPQGSKSDLEAGINIVSRQDKLRELSRQISRIRERSDYNFLGLKFGKDNIYNMAFYGSDFFLETQKSIYDLIKSAPNPIEVKSLLIKSARNRNRFNIDNFTREYILYQIIPYSTKEDFDIAVKEKQVGEITFQFQTRFNHWVSIFESQFGDLLTFWDSYNITENEKVILINNLITTIIRDNYEKSNLVEDLSRERNSET